MPASTRHSWNLVHCFRTIGQVLIDLCRPVFLLARSRRVLATENLFLRKRLALFRGRTIKPHRANDSTRWLMAVLSRLFDGRTALVVVKPDTLIRWHRKGFRLFWGWKSRPVGRPRLPKVLQELIRKMAAEHPTWGEERIANELKRKLGIRVSPRTVQRYAGGGGWSGRDPDPSQRWLTFVHNHAQAMVACDFFVAVTARFRILYVFVIMELGTRKILHHNVSAHPTAEWTVQQFRQALPGGHPYRFVIHDRDSVFSRELDEAVTAMGVRILRTPVKARLGNSVCEGLVGTVRRECLDFIIPLGERHLRRTLQLWVDHYNRGRPHMTLGPGIPQPTQGNPPATTERRRLPAGPVVRTKAVAGEWHHEYWLEKVAA